MLLSDYRTLKVHLCTGLKNIHKDGTVQGLKDRIYTKVQDRRKKKLFSGTLPHWLVTSIWYMIFNKLFREAIGFWIAREVVPRFMSRLAKACSPMMAWGSSYRSFGLKVAWY